MTTQQDHAPDESLASLVSSAIIDTQELVKGQIELTKAEVKSTMKDAASTSGMFIGAAVLGFLAFIFILVAAAYGIVAAGLPQWAGFLIVALVLLVITGILGLLGRNRINAMTPPERSIAALSATREAIVDPIIAKRSGSQ